MRIELEISENNEGTDCPYWLIIDPEQMLKPRANIVAMNMIYGLFFSREEAEEELKNKNYFYSKRAEVWCLSGNRSKQYSDVFKYSNKEFQIKEIIKDFKREL